MGEVINHDFLNTDENIGYITNDQDPKNIKIEGVYVDGLSAMVKNKEVFIGAKGIDKILNPTSLSLQEMNRFCVMWLCIFDPDVIKEDE